MDYFFLFLISTIFVYPNLPRGLTGWSGAIPGIFVFLQQSQQRSELCICKAFLSCSTQKVPHYLSERGVFRSSFFQSQLTKKEKRIVSYLPAPRSLHNFHIHTSHIQYPNRPAMQYKVVIVIEYPTRTKENF